MFRLFVRIALLTIIFAVLVVLVRTVGGQGKNPLVDIFSEVALSDGQKQVCWHKICPNLTTLLQATDILATNHLDYLGEHSSSLLCWGKDKNYTVVCLLIDGDQIQRMLLYDATFPDESFLTNQIGEFVALWGTPVESIINAQCNESIILFGNKIVMNTRDLHPQGQPIDVSQLDARSRHNILVIPPITDKTDLGGISFGSSMTTWRGFALSRGNYVGCSRD